MGVLGMTHAGYVMTGWLVTFGAVGGYAVMTLLRGRRLSKRVPPRERRWS
jgi:heme exporter protein CcmD